MKKILVFIFTLFLLQQIGVAMENIIRFDNNTYNLSHQDINGENYLYYLENENTSNWHSRMSLEHIIDKANATEASAEFAHQIQSENPAASVLVYPDAATVGFLTFPPDKEYYEYNAVVFKGNNGLGLKKITYSKRFYSSENGGAESARLAAISFAEDYNKKYMELLNREAAQINLN